MGVVQTKDGAHKFDFKLLIETDSDEALLIRKRDDGGDIFSVNTTTGAVTMDQVPSLTHDTSLSIVVGGNTKATFTPNGATLTAVVNAGAVVTNNDEMVFT